MTLPRRPARFNHLRLAVALACGSNGCGCDIAATDEDLAGPDAMDCGAADGTHAASAWSCAVDAFQRGEPFTVTTTRSSTDSTVTTSTVSDGQSVWKLSQDDSGLGPGGIDGWDCVAPFVSVMQPDQYDPDAAYGYEFVSCADLAPKNNHYDVCGSTRGENPKPLPFDP
jgi:hypothetical protein